MPNRSSVATMTFEGLERRAKCRGSSRLRGGCRRRGLPCQDDRLGTEARDQARVAVPKADDVLDAVAPGELEDQTADDVVDSRTETPARHDRASETPRVEEYLVARAGKLERRGPSEVPLVLLDLRNPVVDRHPVGLPHIVDGRTGEPMGERGGDVARPEDFHLDVLGHDSVRPLRSRQADRHSRGEYGPRVSQFFRRRCGRRRRDRRQSALLSGPPRCPGPEKPCFIDEFSRFCS
jgi:hypothetical protein